MSASIGSRSRNQCRSHHQKMLKKHCDILGIVTVINRSLGRESKGLEEEKEEEKMVEVRAETIDSQSGKGEIIECEEKGSDIWDDLFDLDRRVEWWINQID